MTQVSSLDPLTSDQGGLYGVLSQIRPAWLLHGEWPNLSSDQQSQKRKKGFCMRKGIIVVTILQLLAFVSLDGEVHADLVITPGSVRIYTDNVGPNGGFLEEDRYLVIRALITPSSSNTTAQALQEPVSHPLNYNPQPLPSLSDLYSSRTPYNGETGTWLIVAKYGDTETVVTTTYPLDDPQLLPLATNLSVSGPLLTPTFTWDSFEQEGYSSFFYPSYAGQLPPLGYDYYMQTVTVRLAEPGMPIVYQSSPFYTNVASYTVGADVLIENKNYLFDLMLTHSDLYSVTPSFITHLESVSETFLPYSTNPVPIPASMWLLASGLLGLAGFRRKFRKS